MRYCGSRPRRRSFCCRPFVGLRFDQRQHPSEKLWPIYIGTRKGFFAEADIAVDFVFSPSNSATIQ
jgi:hypothetical protein